MAHRMMDLMEVLDGISLNMDVPIKSPGGKVLRLFTERERTYIRAFIANRYELRLTAIKLKVTAKPVAGVIYGDAKQLGAYRKLLMYREQYGAPVKTIAASN